MNDFRNIINSIFTGSSTTKELVNHSVYPDSINKYDDIMFFIAKDNSTKKLIIAGEKLDNFNIKGLVEHTNGFVVRVCPLNSYNARHIRKLFPFTKPQSFKNKLATMGFGDRLGIATPGHIKAIKKHNIFPVLAQQSIKELTLTGRTFENVIDDVTWAVFQEGYKKGYGADAHNLKNIDEIEEAISAGYTMLTLDCSDFIENILPLSKDTKNKMYKNIDSYNRKLYEERYLKTHKIENLKFIISPDELMDIILAYNNVINFVENIYTKFIRHNNKISLELSIFNSDEPTNYKYHYVLADILLKRGVIIEHFALNFTKSVQVGIDFNGNIKTFKKEFDSHLAISRYCGHKLSIHSGSDKFSIYPIIAKESLGQFHLKTSGTSWLEALRTISIENPLLFKEIYAFCVKNLSIAQKYYSTNISKSLIRNIQKINDKKIPKLLNSNDIRQLFHITYGLILQEKKEGNYIYRGKIYKVLIDNIEKYDTLLENHFNKHLDLLEI